MDSRIEPPIPPSGIFLFLGLIHLSQIMIFFPCSSRAFYVFGCLGGNDSLQKTCQPSVPTLVAFVLETPSTLFLLGATCEMKYSQLAPFLIVLLNAFGEVGPEGLTDFQEDCAGDGALTSGGSPLGFRANRRDATCLIAVSSLSCPEKRTTNNDN